MTAPYPNKPVRAFPRGSSAWACLAAAVGFALTAGAPTPGSAATAVRAEAVWAVPADTTETAHTAADVAFMRGMIHHHAQAVVMARMAPDRAAGPAVRRLTARILNSQKTEISIMADWLRDRDEPVPEIVERVVDAADDVTPPGGWDAGPQMPGVLSDAKMARLEAARGEDFDRLFLRYMIDHHAGAVVMVDHLVRSPGGAREASVFRLASGIRADQSTEIDRMRTMLRASFFGDDSP